MTAKEYLQRGWNLEQRVRVREEQLARLRDRMARIRGSAPKGLAGDRHGPQRDWTDAIDALVDAEADYVKEIRDLCLVKRQITDALSDVEPELYRELLQYRYVYGMGWEEIAEKLQYDKRYVFRLHEKALKVVKCADVPGGEACEQ